MRIGGKADLNEHTRHAGLAMNLVVRGYGLPGIGGIDLAQLLLDEDGQLLTSSSPADRKPALRDNCCLEEICLRVC